MPRASSIAAAKQREAGLYARPRGEAPRGFENWDSARGVWADDAGHERPAASKAQRKVEQQRIRRGEAALQRDRNAARGREYLGLYVRIPWAGWGGEWAESDEYDTGTIVNYIGNAASPFVVAFDPDLEYDDVALTWPELLGEKPYLGSPKIAELARRDHVPLGKPQPGRAPKDHRYGGHLYWDMREEAWFDRKGGKVADRAEKQRKSCHATARAALCT